ncbi:ATP-binding protein [Streptomyces sp. NPDC057910]|uniref:ATP-binding protein n=1 Tax=Streptomyces sp. NPDC057910 TaxID=3346278 RepID=UPI0036E2B614
MQFSSTLRGARLARPLAVQHLAEHGIERTADTSRAVATVVAEFAANAITHGHTPGRDFEVRLALTAYLVRIEVADTRPDRFSRTPADGHPRTAVPVRDFRPSSSPGRRVCRALRLVRPGQLHQDRLGRSGPAVALSPAGRANNL